MSPRDRFGNLLAIGAGLVSWLGVAQVLTTTYPQDAGLAGAGIIGLACGLTCIPVFWLIAFARHRRIALLGDWGRALRRAAWVGGIVALFVALRVQSLLSLPVAVFVIVLVLLAEIALSAER